MPCNPLRDKDDRVVGFVCTRGQKVPACSEPGCTWRSERLCDYPLRGEKAGQTCDRPLCRRHARRVGPDRDYCPPHATEAT